MAYEIPGQIVTFKASTGVLSTTGSTGNRQYRFVALNDSGQVIMPTTGGAIVGVLQNKPRTENDSASVMTDGLSKINAAGSTLAASDLTVSDSSGRAVAVSAGDYVVGRIVGGSSGSTGRILTVMLQNIGSTEATT